MKHIDHTRVTHVAGLGNQTKQSLDLGNGLWYVHGTPSFIFELGLICLSYHTQKDLQLVKFNF
jgi:hypothetical protein